VCSSALLKCLLIYAFPIVLRRLNDYLANNVIASVFSIRKDIVQQWLEDARHECHTCGIEDLEAAFGGPPFFIDDAQTHWTDPLQLYTWWKNNIERKSKFKVLQEDVQYTGPDSRKAQR
jgi:hypothetical protein